MSWKVLILVPSCYDMPSMPTSRTAPKVTSARQTSVVSFEMVIVVLKPSGAIKGGCVVHILSASQAFRCAAYP